MPNRGVAQSERVERWKHFLMSMTYTIHHIPGTANGTADLMSRWGLPQVEGCQARISALTTFTPLINPMGQSEFEFPTVEELEKQCDRGVATGEVSRDKVDGLKQLGKVWISPSNKTLETRLLVITHFGLSSHRSNAVIINELSKRFKIENLTKKVAAFSQHCLICAELRGS